MNTDELQTAVINALFELEPAECQPDALIEHEFFEIDTTADTNDEWLAIMAEQLLSSRNFEIHCWNGEDDAIYLVLQFGEKKPSNWHHGVVIGGEVTPQFVAMLLAQPKPGKRMGGNAFTPFFTIRLDNGFESSHYGTELIKIRC